MLIAVYTSRRKLFRVVVNSSAIFPSSDKCAASRSNCFISHNNFKRPHTAEGSFLVFRSALTSRFTGGFNFQHSHQYFGLSVRHVNSIPQQDAQGKADRSNQAEKPLAKVDAKQNTQLLESRWTRFKRAAKKEALHYWHGAKLFWIDLKIATGLLLRMSKGEQLTRRERKQLARTTADMFRLVPFSVFVVVPFLELTLPLFLKLFPNMLPSTFAEEKNEEKNRHRILKGKLEMAKFLQDTLEQTAAVQKRVTTSSTPTDAKTITMTDFANFMHGIRASGKLASPDDIKKFSTLFEDELTLDTMTRSQLQACCKLLEVSALGPIGLLRHRLRVRLRELEADDMLILKEGIESLSTYELQVACRERGMRSIGVSELRLRSQLHDWLTLNIKEKLPTTLLLLSRAMYIPENVPVEDQLTKVMSLLPDIAAVQAQLRAGERSGELVSNTLIMEVIEKEQEAITRERAETRQAELALRSQQDTTEQHVLTTNTAQGTAMKQSDTQKLESAIQHVAGKQLGAALQQAELAELKQDILEYKDDLKSSIGKDVSVSKLSQQLAKRIDQLIGQVDLLVDGLQKRRQTLAKEKMVAVDDLLRELASLQMQAVSKRKQSSQESQSSLKDEAKWQRILQVLDYDRDGQISIKDAVKLVEMLKDEKLVAIAEKDVLAMVEALRHESELEQTNHPPQIKADERAS